MNRGSRSLTIYCGMPQNFSTLLRNNWAAVSAEQWHGGAVKMPYFENLSTTTIIDPQPSNSGNAEMKSIEAISYGRFGIGRVSKRPPLFFFSILSCWQTRQDFTYSSISVRMWVQKYSLSSKARVRLVPGCPAHLVYNKVQSGTYNRFSFL